MQPHINHQGEFQSDKNEEWCPPGFVPLKLSDKMAQPFLWGYAEERREKDPEFSQDLQECLKREGYDPGNILSIPSADIDPQDLGDQ